MEEYKDMMRGTSREGLDPSCIVLFDNGYYTIISSSGKMYNAFCKDKTLGNYTGANSVPKPPNDVAYHDSSLRILPFDQAFTFLSTDVDKRKYMSKNIISTSTQTL